jgi:hypothetical protein
MKKPIRKTKTQKRKTQKGGYNAESIPIQSSIMKVSPRMKSYKKSYKKIDKKYPKQK